MALLRRRIHCHYCNTQSRDTVSHIPSQYLCPHCDATNHFDRNGKITDPPAEAVVTAPSATLRYVHSRSPSPVMSAPSEELFCGTCQRNQVIVAKIVAEYLPEETHPEYAQLDTAFDGYRAELEERYPQVCKDCKERVDFQLQKAGYLAKADHLRRIMEKSEQRRQAVQTARQTWTLRLIALAKWTYIVSFVVQMLWHIFGCMMASDERVWDDGEIPITEQFSWDICASQAVWVRSVDESCVLSPAVTKVVLYAIFADALTLWWNPRLKDKTNSITGQMRGLTSLWAIRAATLLLRTLSLYFWPSATVGRDTLTTFHNTHLCMLFAMALSFILTFKTVRITYHTPLFFQRSVNEHASTSNSAERPIRHTNTPAHPQATAFDTMPQGFTSSFQDDHNAAAFPPSPTLTASSYTTHATEATTPGHKSTRGDEGEMDWIPAQPRFAHQQPTVYPSPWAQQPSPPPYTKPHAKHSLFAEPDPNPFRHRVPAAPKAPAQAKVDPWNRGPWAPPVKEATPTFFKADHKAGSGVGETKGLEGFGVPKNIQRDAELFASPKLKYDYYGTMKNTGLEDRFEETFNDFFAK